GTWRMPTSREYDRLPRPTTNHNVGFFQYAADNDRNDYLRIYALGRLENNRSLDDYDRGERTAYYWTRTRDEDDETDAFTGEIEIGDDDVDDYETDDKNNHHGFNIRCVRAE